MGLNIYLLNEKSLNLELEGVYRPGYFTGMLTIIMKLLNIVQPWNAYFGEKDYQQILLIEKMVSAMFLDVKIVRCKTIREKDGLALSSRNTRLNFEQRKKATLFPQLLHSDLSIGSIETQLKTSGFKVEYIVEKWGRRLGAAWLDSVRLIDNVEIKGLR